MIRILFFLALLTVPFNEDLLLSVQKDMACLVEKGEPE